MASSGLFLSPSPVQYLTWYLLNEQLKEWMDGRVDDYSEKERLKKKKKVAGGKQVSESEK